MKIKTQEYYLSHQSKEDNAIDMVLKISCNLMYLYICRVTKNSKERKESLPQRSVQSNRGKQQNGKDQRPVQENQRYQGKFSCKDNHNKGQKFFGPNRNIRYLEEVVIIHRRTIQKRS